MASKTDRNKIQYTDDPLIKYAAEHSVRLHPVQQKLIEFTQTVPRSGMLSSADEIQLLQNLVRCIGAKKALDIGVYTGYSAMSIAMVLPSDGKVIACDVSTEFTSLGKPFWEEAGVADKIQLAIAPAAETLQKLLDDGEAGTFDFAFVDADKTGYDVYYELCLKLVRPNGIIAFDNILWSGSVCNPEKTDLNVESLRSLVKKIHADERVYVSLLTVGDGTLLAFKK